MSPYNENCLKRKNQDFLSNKEIHPNKHEAPLTMQENNKIYGYIYYYKKIDTSDHESKTAKGTKRGSYPVQDRKRN